MFSNEVGDCGCELKHTDKGELLYYPQAKIYDHTLLTKQSYAFDA